MAELYKEVMDDDMKSSLVKLEVRIRKASESCPPDSDLRSTLRHKANHIAWLLNDSNWVE